MENARNHRSGNRLGLSEPAGDHTATSPRAGKIKACCCAALLAAAALLGSPAMAQPLGLVADDETDSVTVLDLGGHAVLGAVPVGPGAVGDVAITPDQTLGFATDFNRRVWVIDLTTLPPSLAAGTNPIAISNPGEELTVTSDGRFLLVNNGSGAPQPISVIDIAARRESSTLMIGSDIVSNDICDDGSSVLVASVSGRNVRRLSLDAEGRLSDTGEVLPLDAGSDPLNVYCAPGSNAGLVVSFTDNTFRSFTVPGLQPVDARTLLGLGNSAVFSAEGDRVFVRSGNPGSVELFDFDRATGALGAAARDSVSVASAVDFFGMDQLALGAGGAALYVPEGMPVSAVSVIDAADQSAPLLASITGPNIVNPTGIVLARAAAFAAFEAFDVALELEHDDELELEGEFTLAAASNGIDPLAEEVTLAIGSLSVTIPAGTFKTEHGGFEFEGRIGGAKVEFEIEPLIDRTYRIEAEVEGIDVSGVTPPVSVALTIGDDRGETVAVLEDHENHNP